MCVTRPGKMAKLQEVLAGFDYVRFAVCDLNGTYRGETVPGRHAGRVAEEGFDLFEGLMMMGPRSELIAIDDEHNYNLGNALAFPDPETLRLIPWAQDGYKVGEVLCETRWKKDNTPQEACPRFAARKQLKKLDDLGLRLYSGYEVEFALYERDSLKPINYCIDVMSHRLQNHHNKLFFEFEKNLLKSQVDIERFHPEYGNGMFEAIMAPKYGIQSADAAMNLRQGVMEMADLQGLFATFMSKVSLRPFDTTGQHFNYSIWDRRTGKNMFFDANKPDRLSATAKQWVAGLLKHAKALCAFSCPTVNCYRRIHEPYHPSDARWGIEDREAALRVKNLDPSRTYIESRMPSGKSNAYLVMAATIAAGLDGVDKKLECPPSGQVPNADVLPKSLSSALEELERDTVIVEAMGKDLVRWFIKSKRDAEIALYDGLSNEESFALEKEKYFI